MSLQVIADSILFAFRRDTSQEDRRLVVIDTSGNGTQLNFFKGSDLVVVNGMATVADPGTAVSAVLLHDPKGFGVALIGSVLIERGYAQAPVFAFEREDYEQAARVIESYLFDHVTP